MRITHFGHACLYVETDDARILIDPGSFSSGFEDLRDLSAIAVTHQHADHVDADRFKDLVAANPDARLFVEPDTVTELGLDSDAAFAAASTATVGDVELAGMGGLHALNHDRVPQVGNVGLLLTSSGTTVFHPGDSYSETPDGVDVLALPLNAPWCKIQETLDFYRAVAPGVAIPIHDSLLSDLGKGMYVDHCQRFGPTDTSIERLAAGDTFDA